MIAAPSSGSGKTTITLGLLRALKSRGIAVTAAKAGPDFIDPKFHGQASGVECVNLDPWGMRRDMVSAITIRQTADLPPTGCFVVEAMMGLFDGGADGTGSAADLATHLGMPVILVVDAAKQSHSIAALVSGFRDFRNDLNFAGVILNRVGSPRHDTLLREALGTVGVPVFGSIFRDEKLQLPSRHLGLVQAEEHIELEQFIEHAADVVSKGLDWDAVLALQMTLNASSVGAVPVSPLGQRIAVAHDTAFSFSYPHLLNGWRDQGADFAFFSPLANEAPRMDCDAVYLPGGYPELHAEKIASNTKFLNGLREAAERGAFVYGECGGFMVLGQNLIDADGKCHAMAGLLPHNTSFETRKLHLGYRVATVLSDLPFANSGARLAMHEFHYSSLVEVDDTRGSCAALFDAKDARGENIGPCGLARGNVAGSYLHLIDLF